jgi:hypothetical protein
MRGSNRHDCPAHGAIDNDYSVVASRFLLSSISTVVRTSCLPEFLPGSLFFPRWLWPPPTCSLLPALIMTTADLFLNRLLLIATRSFESIQVLPLHRLQIGSTCPSSTWLHQHLRIIARLPLLLLPPALMVLSRYGCVISVLVRTTGIHQAMLLYPYMHSFALIN